MSDNKTKPTGVSVDTFLASIDEKRRKEAQTLISMMQQIADMAPVMWGPSIIGFGSQHYKYDSGREGDMPQLGFSPRKSAITIYFNEGFDRYEALLTKLGKYKSSVSCLYVNKLEDIDGDVLRRMIEMSYQHSSSPHKTPSTLNEYLATVPAATRPHFDELRALVQDSLPAAKEVLSYGIVGYKVDDKRARVYISGWSDHVAIYPIPRDEILRAELTPYVKGKGTLWFSLEAPLPTALIKKTVQALV